MSYHGIFMVSVVLIFRLQTMTLNHHQNQESPLWQIVEHLQRNGASSIKELEDVLGVTTTAVRQHLSSLQAEGYIRRETERDSGVGRPSHAYALTDKARELFACRCDDLALAVLEEVFALEGNDRTQVLLDRVGTKLANRYASGVKSTVLTERVDQLAGALEQRGVLTDVMNGDDVIELKMYNCPFHELATVHKEICDMDTAMIGKVLGKEVTSTSCIMDGQSSCNFVVSR